MSRAKGTQVFVARSALRVVRYLPVYSVSTLYRRPLWATVINCRRGQAPTLLSLFVFLPFTDNGCKG